MYFSASTVDDLLNKVLRELLQRPFDVSPSRGPTSELIGAMLHLTNPRARLSRDEEKGTVFSGLGELLWYLSADNKVDFIQYYISAYAKETQGDSVHGGYGPRLFHFRNEFNQIDTIIRLLKDKPYSRRAVIQLLDAADIAGNYKEIPCTCTLQFFLRDEKLHMFTSMRSNDAYMGLPHDIFTFTMLQEIIACSLEVEVGHYTHAVGSLHLYKNKKDKAQEYLNAGLQSTTYPMPSMPRVNPWVSIQTLLQAEKDCRENNLKSVTNYELNPYWADIACLLQAFAMKKARNIDKLHQIRNDLSYQEVYKVYINKCIENLS